MITPEQALEVIRARFGLHTGFRALHAKGKLYAGEFEPTPAAAELTRAPHMQGGPVPAIARFSNGGGDPGGPDYAPDVRGLAVTFELPDGQRTDISAQTAPRFPFRDPEAFIDFVKISKPSLGSAARLPLYVARHPHVLKALRVNMSALVPPPSFAARPYFAIHAFRWIDADGGERWVRYRWRPTIELEPLARGEAKRRGRDYLFEELEERLAREPVRMELDVQIAGDGDDPNDPSTPWPDERRRVHVGTLTITEPTDRGDEMVFDPTRVIDGIELSDDPVLRFRPRAYSISHEARA